MAAALASFGAAWMIQGMRWDLDVQGRDLAAATAISVNVTAVADKMQVDRVESEKARAAYLDYKKGAEIEISNLERRVTAGPERLYIKASCPTVPATGADASRAGSGTARLDADSTRTYFALERGIAEQYGLLQLCRSELKKRSK